jgi:hypothetical protein
MWKRLRRLLLRWQAPQPCPAHRENDRTRPDSGTLDGSPNVRQSYAKGAPKLRTRWRTLPRLRHRRYRRQEPLRGASRPQKPRATGPPWGKRSRARLIHSSPGRLQGAAFGGTLTHQPAGRRMERSRFQRTFGAPPSTTAISFAIPILAEDCAPPECDDPLCTRRGLRLGLLCDDSPVTTSCNQRNVTPGLLALLSAWRRTDRHTPRRDEPSVAAQTNPGWAVREWRPIATRRES